MLFRDFPRASEPHAARWAEFKTALARLDIYAYGQAKQPAWELLMEIAEAWATRTGWQPGWLSPAAPSIP